MPGERNELRYAPRGVCAVIAPWNFPLAIPMGMTAAALATGNTVVLKPAEQAPGCGLRVVEALRAGGVPAGAIALLPGEGDAGAALARHPDVATIAFTGSGPVGLELLRTAADVRAGRAPAQARRRRDGRQELRHRRRRRRPRRGRPGDRRVRVRLRRPEVLGRVARARPRGARTTRSSSASPAPSRACRSARRDDFATDVPPVIERRRAGARARYAQRAADAGRRHRRRRASLPRDGWYCAPARRDRPAARLARSCATRSSARCWPSSPSRDVDEACDRVDALPVALTGGLFARNPRTVERVVARSPVGNLYVNRSTTGAMVGRQPFGGNRLSGTGTKAGGGDYLLHFVEPRVVTENTVRHGLVV